MTLLNVFAISGLVNALIVLVLGIFIIFHNWRDKTNRLYFLIVMAICLWSLSYWRWLSSSDELSALFWVRLLSVGSTLIPVFYFHWIASLLKFEKKEKTTIWLVYILGGLFLLFSFSDLFVSGVQQKLFFPFWPNPGILYHFYLFAFYICLVIYSGVLLVRTYKISFGEDKKRMVYLLGGSIIAFGGGLSNFFLWYNIPIAPYGNFLVAFYVVLFGYATIKYRLFNVQTIATELFAIAIWIFFFIKILLSISFNDLLVNIFLFIAVVFFGILLIRSVFKEVKQKEQMEQMAKEIERAYEVEKQANKELEKLDKYKNNFLMQAQHDMRSPLSTLMGYTDLLVDGSYGKLSKGATGTVVRMQDIIQNKIKDVNNFLDIEQFKMGKGVVALKPGVDLSSILEEIISALSPKTQGKGIYLKFERPEEAFVVTADREKLKAAIFNIADNAVKYTEKGGVAIMLKKEKEKIKVEIKDSGIGIPQDKIKNIFEEQFERTQRAQRTASGSGIGLYLSGQIIKLHNGKVWAESNGEGNGSMFYIELPIS